MKKRIILTLLLLLFAFVSFIPAQTADQKNPYKEGESLTYEGKYKRFGLAFSIAELNFTISKLPETEHYLIKSEARSKGTLVSLFNFKFYQHYQSTVDSEELRILKTVKQDVQRSRVRESDADFDYQTKKVVFIETDPKDPTRPPRRVASTIGFDTQDIVSAVYLLRSKELAVGKTFVFSISDSGLVYDVPVKITARERKKSILGKKWCWRIEPEVFGDGRMIEQKGSLTIWITDDEQRIPIRAELETKLGDVRIKLKKMQTKDVDLEDDGKDEDEEDNN
jgi:hypothetical protein